MNIFSYLDKYGSKTFSEEPFNEVDNAIFSGLIYVDTSKYVSSNNKNKRTINEVGTLFFKEFDKNKNEVMAVRNGIKILKYIYETERFKNLLLYNYSYISSHEEQFSAITIELDKKTVYISFEGTDQLISGWKENFTMSYKFPVLAQRQAINYVNNRFTFSTKKIILGGHSKGGNLALVAGMYANMIVKPRIINIYSNDGPGLRDEQLNSKAYQSIKERLIHFIPSYSIIGLLFNHENDTIIKSTKKTIVCHALVTWVVDGNKFVKDETNKNLKVLENAFNSWIKCYNNDERERFVKSLFMACDRANISDLVEVMENKKLILTFFSETKGIDDTTKKMMNEFVKIIIKYYKESVLDDLTGLFRPKNKSQDK